MFKIASLTNPNGEVWDHKGKTELVQIFISYGDDGINFLQFLYVEDGSLVLSERIGNSDNGNNFNTVKLNYPDEFLTSISGCYRSFHRAYDDPEKKIVMTSITFGTNQGSYGPFGQLDEYGTNFNFQMGQDRSFGGFYGSTESGFLESIGVYVKPLTTLINLKCAEEINGLKI